MKTIYLFAGSFDPMHTGHLNIIDKIANMFGRENVIVAMGINFDKVEPENRDKYFSDKMEESIALSKRIKCNVICYKTFLHELIEHFERQLYKVILVRGLRNGSDLNYEANQMRIINDFKKDINCIYVTCDVEFEHISSSVIRTILKSDRPKLSNAYLV